MEGGRRVVVQEVEKSGSTRREGEKSGKREWEDSG